MMRTRPTSPSTGLLRLAITLAFALVLASCASGVQEPSSSGLAASAQEDSVASEPHSTPPPSVDRDEPLDPTPNPTPEVEAPLPEFGEALPSALGPVETANRPTPIGLSYPAIGVESAPIIGVGVEPTGEMEIPGAEEIGWYEYGVAPGEPGSAVLAAHIAFDNVDGVFRDLGQASLSDEFTIEMSDGTVANYIVYERSQYKKDQLPFDSVFARDGLPIVTLISCGGTFQRSLESYEDNIVAYAIPAKESHSS